MEETVVCGMCPVCGREEDFSDVFEDGQNKEMSPSSLKYVCEKEEVGKEVDETLSYLPKRGQGELLTIHGDNFCEVDNTFVKGVYFSIFYWLCFVEDISPNIAEEQVMEEKTPDLEWEEDFRFSDDRGQKWRGVGQEDNYYMCKFHLLSWWVYTKDKEGFMNRQFLVEVPHTKG